MLSAVAVLLASVNASSIAAASADHGMPSSLGQQAFADNGKAWDDRYGMPVVACLDARLEFAPDAPPVLVNDSGRYGGVGLLSRAALAAVVAVALTGCSRSTSEAKIFGRFGIPVEASVVATAQEQTGFNLWTLRFPAGFPIEEGIVWPTGYKQDTNAVMDDGPDCASALIAVSADCRSRPVAVKVGPGGRHGRCTASLNKLVQSPMIVDGKPVEFAQLVIDC